MPGNKGASRANASTKADKLATREAAVDGGGRAIFIVDHITFNPDDDLPQHPHDLVLPPKSLMPTHKTPLDTIMGSTLNQAGRVKAIYLNMQAIGWISVNPHVQGVEDIGPTAFENMLRQLSHIGKLFNAHNNEVIGHTVTGVSAIFCDFPINTPVISFGDSMKLVDYVSAADDDKTFVFVVS